MKLEKKLVFALFLISAVLISGCSSGKKDVQKSLEEIRTGTEGIALRFLPNAPPDKIHAEEGADPLTTSFDVVLELRNKGAFPQPGPITSPNGVLYLSGYDQSIMSFIGQNPPVENLGGKALEGKSAINPNGGLDLATFKGVINTENLNVEKYEPTLLATACYDYQTVAGPSVCIDPDPYSVNEKKVCQVQDTQLNSQGAPVAVTQINEEAFATKTQFKITIKNVGNGDVIKIDSLKKCSPSGDKIGRDDIDKVYLFEAKVGSKTLNCGPFANIQDGNTRGLAGDIRLINGEGYIICELPSSDYSGSKTAYTTPMTINLLYGYRNSIEKKIQIKKETAGISGVSRSSQTNDIGDRTAAAQQTA